MVLIRGVGLGITTNSNGRYKSEMAVYISFNLGVETLTARVHLLHHGRAEHILVAVDRLHEPLHPVLVVEGRVAREENQAAVVQPEGVEANPGLKPATKNKTNKSGVTVRNEK